MDYEFDPKQQNILDTVGFSNMIFYVLNLKPGSGAWVAPVCSSWVYMSRGSTGRTKSNPLGWTQYSSVVNQNILAARTVLLLLLCQARKIWWCMEQPTGSLLERHPIFQMFLKLPSVSCHRLATSMAWFGGSIKKPTWIYSSGLFAQFCGFVRFVF